MLISMPRGDMVAKSFAVCAADGSPLTDTLDEIYITVKKCFRDKTFKFQKRLSNGDITSLGEGRYQFTIMPEDTDNLDFGEYVFDIELVITGRLKKTFVGKLRLTDEVTYASNEEV